jgi:PAS domain S-box-containing protein
MPQGRAEAGHCSASPENGIFTAVDLARLLDSIQDVIITIDGQATVTGLNAATPKLFGTHAGRMIGRPLFDFLHAGEHAAFQGAIDALRLGISTSVPLRLRISGTNYTARPLAAVTYRYKAEGKEQFILIGREEGTAPDPIAVVAGDAPERMLGRWRYEFATQTHSWSDSVGRYIGHEGHQRVVGDFGLTELHPEDLGPVKAIFEKAIADKSSFFFRCRSRGKNGQYRLFETYAFVEMDRNGDPAAVVGISYDVTQADETIKTLRRNVDELQELFAEITDYIIRVDARGNIQYVSPSITRVLGYEPKELVKENSLALAHPDDIDFVLNAVRSLRTVGESISLPHRVLHQDGHWVWIEAKVRVLQIGPKGYPSETVSVCRDITARKQAEEELAAAYARAEAASATKSRFLANMSHELRTPLNAIIGFSDIIKRELFGAVGSARYKEYAQLIQDSGGHLLDLINDILDMSKIEAGKFDLRFEPVDLEDVISASLKLLEPRAQQAKLILTAELSGEKPHIQADRRAIKQILLNLLTNSIKFTPPGGVVTASLQTLTDGVALQVRDTGIGIAEKDLPRVTLPFEQVTHDPLLAQAGSGLGLALVQSLVNLHMGTLKIDSATGEGTLVTVFLPSDPRSRRAA